MVAHESGLSHLAPVQGRARRIVSEDSRDRHRRRERPLTRRTVRRRLEGGSFLLIVRTGRIVTACNAGQ